MLKVADFSYQLPANLIAQKPIRKRESSRLLVLNKTSGEIEHSHFNKIINYLEPGDVLVLNNSKVFPARLYAEKKITGGEIEIFLHQKKTDYKGKNIWECLLRGRVKKGLELVVTNKLKAKLVSDNNGGTYLLEFNLSNSDFWQEIYKVGQMPLPPYIKRDKSLKIDKTRYQTVFAKDNKKGSVAAPTAGLHFSEELIDKIKEKGVVVKFITLHVGLGTFETVKVEKVTSHKMHSEYVEISKNTIKAIHEAKRKGKKVIAVGTTSCRSLEAAADDIYLQQSLKINNKLTFWTDIFIYPGYKFKIIDGLITNFHLPSSTLLMLVSAFAGKDYIDKAYQKAIENEYRFFSYGDAMFIR